MPALSCSSHVPGAQQWFVAAALDSVEKEKHIFAGSSLGWCWLALPPALATTVYSQIGARGIPELFRNAKVTRTE